MDAKVPYKNIADLAVVDPIAALGFLLQIPVVPTVINCPFAFSSFDVGSTTTAKMDTTLTQRTWIDNIAYSLQQPNVFAGSVLKPQYDAYLKQQPGISVELQVQAGPKYTIQITATPLENLSNLFAMRWMNGWRLEELQTIAMKLTLTQAPPSTSPNGPPYQGTITFNAWQFLDYTLEKVTANEAARRLREAGFCVPEVPCIRGAT